jgi:hypothetical protein
LLSTITDFLQVRAGFGENRTGQSLLFQ